MDIVIKLNEDDILACPDIIDTLKACAKKINESRPVCWGCAEPDTASAEAIDETLVKGMEAAAPEQAPWEEPATEQKAPAEPVEEEGPEITASIEEVRDAVSQVSKKHGTKKAKAILEKCGASSISTLDPKHYVAVLKDAKGAL